MKKLLLFLFMFLTYLSSNAQGVWVSQSTGSTEVSTGLRGIDVVDTSVVWVYTYDGSGAGNPRQDYSRTTDGGATWMPGIVPTSNIWDWAQLDAINDSVAWAVFFNQAVSPVGLGQIWHTQDAGATWVVQDSGLIFSTTGQSFPNVINFWNEDSGVVIGDPASGEFEIYTTVDGGANWVLVPAANIPDPTAGEAGWTTHIDVVGDTVWFDTNSGRVYRSVDRGYNWTVSSSGLPVPAPGSIDLCFYTGDSGIARYYDDASITNAIVETFDGGLTWSAVFNPTGNFFGAAVENVPGEGGLLISTGVSSVSGFTGTSYSLNGGHDWTTLETGVQRNALGIADSLTMWTGGFTTSPTEGGIFKWEILNPVACNDPLISPGTTSTSDSVICGGDTAMFTSTGIYSPFIGDNSGLTWIMTSADISGSQDPLNEPSFFQVGTQIVSVPVPSTNSVIFINDGTIVNGGNRPYGIYYLTPIVFGNAIALNIPPVFLQDLVLDLSTPCTYVGTSVAVNIKDPNDVDCIGNKVGEINGHQLSVSSSIMDRNVLDVLIKSAGQGKVSIQVTDITGRIVKTVNTFVSAGSNHELINVGDLSSGTYIVKAEVNGYLATNKVVKY